MPDEAPVTSATDPWIFMEFPLSGGGGDERDRRGDDSRLTAARLLAVYGGSPCEAWVVRTPVDARTRAGSRRRRRDPGPSPPSGAAPRNAPPPSRTRAGRCGGTRGVNRKSTRLNPNHIT